MGLAIARFFSSWHAAAAPASILGAAVAPTPPATLVMRVRSGEFAPPLTVAAAAAAAGRASSTTTIISAASRVRAPSSLRPA
uniref:Uncharacterized protein n=1 Tax=Oryza meridionalis TaxID=40149 RepID=A0A0E0CT11_9ORYZ